MYRTSGDVDLGRRCAAHPAAPALGVCVHCKAAVCVPCGLYDGLHLSCRRCVLVVRRRRRLLQLTAVTLGLGALVLLLVFGVLVSDRYGRVRRESERLARARIEEDPCNLVAVEKRVDRLLSANGPIVAVGVLESTTAQCEVPAAFHERALALHRVIGNVPGQISDLTRLLKYRPRDTSLYRARARLYAQTGDLSWAMDDYDAILRLDPSDGEARREVPSLCGCFGCEKRCRSSTVPRFLPLIRHPKRRRRSQIE